MLNDRKGFADIAPLPKKHHLRKADARKPRKDAVVWHVPDSKKILIAH